MNTENQTFIVLVDALGFNNGEVARKGEVVPGSLIGEEHVGRLLLLNAIQPNGSIAEPTLSVSKNNLETMLPMGELPSLGYEITDEDLAFRKSVQDDPESFLLDPKVSKLTSKELVAKIEAFQGEAKPTEKKSELLAKLRSAIIQFIVTE